MPPKKRAPRKPYCDQCKERRVICDMVKPACSRCQRRGRDCYYAPFPGPPAKKSPGGIDERQNAASSLAHLQPQRHQTPIDLLGADGMQGSPARQRDGGNKYEFVEPDPEREPDPLYPVEPASKDEPSASKPAVPDELITLLFGNSDISKAFFADNARFHAPGWGPPAPTIPLQVNMAPEDIYTNAWVHRLMTAGRVLSRPEGWIAHLARFKTTELLISGVWACGAVELGHELQAAKYYRRCLELLAPRIKVSGEILNYEESVETCACILLLLAYEICNSSLTLHNFNLHLDGLGQILKNHVAYVVKHGKLTRYRMMSPKPDFPGLVYQSFREIESVANLMQGLRPRLSLKEYEMLINIEDCEYITDFEIVKQWNIMHKAATAMYLPLAQRLGALDEISTAFTRYSWSGPGRKEIAASDLTKWLAVPDVRNPFPTNLCYTGQDFQDTLRRTSIALVARSAALRIESSTIERGAEMTADERNAHLEHADELVRIAHFCLSEAAIPPFSWLLLGLFCAAEMYNLACDPKDQRVSWTKSLLATVTKRMGFTPSKINEYIRSVKSMEGFDLAPLIEPRGVSLPHELPKMPQELDNKGLRRSASFASAASPHAALSGADVPNLSSLSVPLPTVGLSPASGKRRRESTTSMRSFRSETQPPLTMESEGQTPTLLPSLSELNVGFNDGRADGSFAQPFHHTHSASHAQSSAYQTHPAPQSQAGKQSAKHAEVLAAAKEGMSAVSPILAIGDEVESDWQQQP